MCKIRNICLTLAILEPLLAGELGRAQSTFHFSNLNPPELDAPIFDAEGNPLTGTNYVAILYGGATVDALSVATLPDSYTQPMQPVPFTLPVAGYFNLIGWVGIPTVSGGGTAWLQVRAWDTRLGATYEDVDSLGLGGYGESVLFQARGGCITCMPPVASQPLIGLQSFSLLPVIPEPSTWALFVLGGMILLRVLRREMQTRS